MKMYEKYYIVSAYVELLFPICFIVVMTFLFFQIPVLFAMANMPFGPVASAKRKLLLKEQ